MEHTSSANKNTTVRMAKELIAVAKTLVAGSDSPSVYVGTYAKYNNGDLTGKWVDLDDFSDYDEFIDYCKELHKDEQEPEFMFQDWENIPSDYITESSIKPETWDYIEKINEYDKDVVDAILENGYSLDSVDDAIYYENCDDWGDLASRIIDEMGGIEQLGTKTLSTYFDYDAFGRDLSFDGNYIEAGTGYVEIR